MRLLTVADAEDPLLVAQLSHGGLGRVDAVVSCGDLRPGYLDFVATAAGAPLYYVRGNHDTEGAGYPDASERGGTLAGGAVATMGGTPLDLHVVEVCGVRIAGLDGSLAYREGIVGFSEARQARRCVLLAAKAALARGVDVLVTHAPPRGYGDLDDLPHRGFACYNWLLEALRPKVLLHGHVHLNYGMVARELRHATGCRIINAFGYQLIEL